MPLSTTSDLTLYSHRQSRGSSVLWLLEELEVEYAVQWLPFGEAMRTPAFLAINPMGKIPALTHLGVVVTETPAILIYLADHFAERSMIPPAGDPARAAFYRWLLFAAGPLEAATTAAFLGWQVPAQTPKGTPAEGFVGFGSLTRTLDVLADHLAHHHFVCGAQMTAADIYVASQLALGIYYTQAYPTRTVFSEYLARMHDRPAKLRAEALSG